MPDDSFVLQEILKANVAIASMSAKIDGFLGAQAAMQAEINLIKGDVSAVKNDIHEIKQQRAVSKSYIAGISATVGVFWVGFSTFILPYLKEKFGF